MRVAFIPAIISPLSLHSEIIPSGDSTTVCTISVENEVLVLQWETLPGFPHKKSSGPVLGTFPDVYPYGSEPHGSVFSSLFIFVRCGSWQIRQRGQNSHFFFFPQTDGRIALSASSSTGSYGSPSGIGLGRILMRRPPATLFSSFSVRMFFIFMFSFNFLSFKICFISCLRAQYSTRSVTRVSHRY